MKISSYWIYMAVILLGFNCVNKGQSSIGIHNLRCEYLTAPLGIDTEQPRFSWELMSTERNQKQKAYRILVSSDSMLLMQDKADLWDSGKTKSNQTNQVKYNGKQLKSRMYCYWKVKIWDDKGRLTPWSEISHWSMGLLDKNDWKAEWIGTEPEQIPKEKQQNSNPSLSIPPCPMLRKEFEITKRVERALLYVSALGIYEVRINGNNVSDQVLAPEWTDYHTRVHYQTYDVTGLLKNGKNVIGTMLADGWFAGAIFSHPGRGSYGFNRRLIAQLEMDYMDGTNSSINTDGSWKVSDRGPVREASIFDGELYDAGLQSKGWDIPGYNDDSWANATIDSSINIGLSAQMNEPVKVVEELSPACVFKAKNGAYIFDIRQNIAGWVNLSLPYKTSGEIVLRYGEMLNKDSTLYVANLRGAKQIDTYIASDKEEVQYEPRFTYHGFRYIEISGLPKPPSTDNIIARVVASSSPVTGSLKTSNKDINKLWQNILWTQRGNMYSVLTDCPQRDERAGWMGDTQVFSQTSIYNMDMAAFFTKWMRDVRDTQAEDGRFPDWAPQVGMWRNHYNSPGWGDAGVIIPWRMYQNYGDTGVLENQYDAMKRYVQHIQRNNPDLIWRNSRGEMYGDWLNGDDIIYEDYPKQGGRVPDDIYSTAFFAYSTKILSKISKVLNKKDDVQHYDSLATAIQKAFVKEFISSEGKIKGNTQAGYALALEFDLVPESLKAKAARYMADAVKAYNYRISTGIQSTIRLMNQLSAAGYSDIAYRLLESRRFPSWLYSVNQGATTIWERWDGYVEGRGFQNPRMNSFNHCAIGAVGEWMYRHILGICYDESSPGYHHFSIKPEPGGSIIWAEGTYHSISGMIKVSWRKNTENFNLDVEIPANTSANIYFPANDIDNITEDSKPVKYSKDFELINSHGANTIIKIGSGKYSFKVDLN